MSQRSTTFHVVATSLNDMLLLNCLIDIDKNLTPQGVFVHNILNVFRKIRKVPILQLIVNHRVHLLKQKKHKPGPKSQSTQIPYIEIWLEERVRKLMLSGVGLLHL